MIAIGCDHAGFEMKEKIKKYLIDNGFDVKDCGALEENKNDDYPFYAKLVCKAINNNDCEKGIVICGTGIGMSISSNKIKGIRCALCSTEIESELSRKHNNANVLALGSRIIGLELAKAIVSKFIKTDFPGEDRNIRRIKMIEDN